MGPWMMGYHNGGWMMILGPIMMLLFIVAAVALSAWVLKAIFPGAQTVSRGESALEILRVRYAKGEIKREEFERMKQELA